MGAGDDEWHDEYEQLQADIRAHPGWLAKQHWEEMRRTIALHLRNLFELEQLIAAPTNNIDLAMELIQNVGPPTVRDEYWAQLDQRLHNALASAVTVVDRARRLVASYPDSDFAAEFHRRNDEIRLDDRAAFIRRLRNYMLHYGLLPLGHSLHFGGEDDGYRFESRLSARDLRTWGADNWGAPAWSYLASVGDHVPLAELVEWYRVVSDALYRWLLDQFTGLHRAEVDAVNGLIGRSNLLLSGGADDGSGQRRL